MGAREHEYIQDPRDFVWLPGALSGMVTLARGGMTLVVVSNQRGVSRGLVPYATLSAIEACIQEALKAHGCRVDSFRYCLHDLEDECDCRKPKPGLLRSAAKEMRLDLARSWMIGDSEEDIDAGRAAGCKTIRIGTTEGPADHIAATLAEAAAVIVAREEQLNVTGARDASNAGDPG